jgi:hypothetical protein
MTPPAMQFAASAGAGQQLAAMAQEPELPGCRVTIEALTCDADEVCRTLQLPSRVRPCRTLEDELASMVGVFQRLVSKQAW